MTGWISRWWRLLAGQYLGSLLTVVEVPALLALSPLARHSGPGTAGLRRLSRVHVRRLSWVSRDWEQDGLTYRAPVAFVWARWCLGWLSIIIVTLITYGAIQVTLALAAWARGDKASGVAPDPFNVAYLLVLSLVLAFLAAQGIRTVTKLEQQLAGKLLRPSQTGQLRGRIAELAASRAEIVAEVDAERRRIERDLHDGVQQRVVALGMLLGRARRGGDPHRQERLLEQAHREAQAVLGELRDVTWRIYPTALDEAGLPAAIEAMAERSALPIEVSVEADPRLDSAVETAAYFVASEAVTNVVKHSGAAGCQLAIWMRGNVLTVRVRDDGRGGAWQGGGLSGLRRRVAALDGVFTLHSPEGGPTIVRAELPCA